MLWRERGICVCIHCVNVCFELWSDCTAMGFLIFKLVLTFSSSLTFSICVKDSMSIRFHALSWTLPQPFSSRKWRSTQTIKSLHFYCSCLQLNCDFLFFLKVSAYGFMTPDYANYSDHYYDKTYHKVGFFVNHDMRMEMNVWQRLHKEGLIKLYMRQEKPLK